MRSIVKVPYEILALSVDKMYPPHYILKPNETIEQHLSYIDMFIESCGWTTEDYLAEYIRRSVDDLFPDVNKVN